MQVKICFGSSAALGVPGSAFFSYDGICYMAGRFLVKQRYEEEQQSFLPLKENCRYHRFLVTPDRQAVVCHNSEEGFHQLVLLSLVDGSSRVLKGFHLENKPIRNFCFLRENELLVIFEGKEVVLLAVQESLPMTPVRTFKDIKDSSVVKLSRIPYLFSVGGKNSLLIFKMDQYEIRLIDNLYAKVFSGKEIGAHCWMNPPYEKYLLVYETSGSLTMVIHSGEVRQELSIMAENLEDHSIRDILVFGEHLLVASANCFFSIWGVQTEGREELISFKKKATWNIGEERVAEYTALDVSDSHADLLLSLRNNDIATIRMPLNDLGTVRFDHLHRGSHEGAIQSLDLCAHLPFAMTLSRADNTVRIWNVQAQECRLLRQFAYKSKELMKGKQTIISAATLL